MDKDLERNEERLSVHPVISAIAGEAEPIFISEDLNNYDHDRKERPINVFQVVDADASQQDAVLLSKKGISFVLQGPPGTGKSQTITNNISEALADGKKVLFVSEKMAALQVVYNRLSNVGLSDFCFTLHSHKVNKKDILRDLADSISVDRKKVREEALAQLDLLERKRESLNKYQDELHTPCSALNTTIFEINGKLAKLTAIPDVIFSIPEIEKVDQQELNNKTYLLQELSKTIGKRSEDYNDNIWKGAVVEYLSNELRHNIDSNVAKIIPLTTELNQLMTQCCSILELSLPNSLSGAKQLVKLLQIAKKSPIIPIKWVNCNDFEDLLTKAKQYRSLTDCIKSLQEVINKKFKGESLNVPAKLLREELIEKVRRIDSYIREDDKNKLVRELFEIQEKITELKNSIELFFNEASSMTKILYMESPSDLERIQTLVCTIEILLKINGVRPADSWFDRNYFNQIKKTIDLHKKLHHEFVTKRDLIVNDFDKEILDLEYYPLLQRFRVDYNSWFKIFKSQYRKDIRLLRGFKNDNKMNFADCLSILNSLKDYHEVKENVSNIVDQCQKDYGQYYKGTETQWDFLIEELATFELLFEIKIFIPSQLKEMLKNGTLPISELNQFLNKYEKASVESKFSLLEEILIFDKCERKRGRIKDFISNCDDALRECSSFSSLLQNIVPLFKEKPNYDTMLEELEKLESYQFAREELAKKDHEISNIFCNYYNGIQTDWDIVNYAILFAKEFKPFIGKYSLNKDIVGKICNEQQMINFCNDNCKKIHGLIESITQPLNWFASLYGNKINFEEFDFMDLGDHLSKCKDKKHLLEEWVDYCSNIQKCEKAGLTPYIKSLNDTIVNQNYIVDAYLKRFYRLWLDQLLPKFPAVRDFRGRIQEQNIDEFCKLDREQFKVAQARVRERIVGRIPDFNSITSSRDEIGILKRELNKQRRIMPLRKLFMAIPNLMSALRPCFMMSPLSVSVFLEANSYEFDLVIFDEASQVHTEDSIGAIMRGKQVIIVGDTKQLPPTNFFATSLNDEDFDNDIDEEAKDSDAGAYESILDEAVTVLPERSLRWHYRSRDEHLIAFSNIKIYNGSLITFPSAIEKASDLGVEYIYVKDGTYDRSGKRYNMVEAKRVAELVFEHFRKHPDRSLGVVTFSEAQQNAVDASIRQMRLNNSSMEKFFNDDLEEPFFIKNLENVQGDERDTIIFSIGYAKDTHGIMYMNFGPLSREGGYRRLNVAITRAKYNVKLVGSIVATDIDLERTSATGVKMLRSYIEYAQQGIAAIENEITYNNDLNFDSPFEEAVYDFLSAKGYEVITQVGCSGFRIDMAIKHPTQKGKFAIGIECDGATYHSSRTARERDRLRQTILEDMGWTIYRIWSTDWIKNPKSEEEKLVKAIDFSLSKTDFGKPINFYGEHVDTEDFTTIEIEEEKDFSEQASTPYGFDYYKSENIADHYGKTIDDVIFNVVESQQPIHFEALCKILAPFWGNQKTTSVIRKNVKYCFKHYMEGMIMEKGDFVTLADFNNLKVRVPKDSNDIRQIEYISEDELPLALTTIAKQSFGIAPEDLITETARVYGFKRTGGKISTVLRKVYSQLEHTGIIKEIDGKVNVVKS